MFLLVDETERTMRGINFLFIFTIQSLILISNFNNLSGHEKVQATAPAPVDMTSVKSMKKGGLFV